MPPTDERLTEADLRVLAMIARMSEGQALMHVLGRMLDRRDQGMRRARGTEDLLRNQGRAIELAELIETMQGAAKRLEQNKSIKRPAVVGYDAQA